MNATSEKVLDSRAVVNVKRKQLDQGNIFSEGAIRVLLPHWSCPTSLVGNLAKQRKLEGSKSNYSRCAFPSGKRLLKYYSNFKKTGILHRLMYYYKDEWNDFSPNIVTIVNKDFVVKKSAIEVEVNGNTILLDFLRMMLLDMNTGLHQPIAWIDVSGECFFPEIFSHHDEPLDVEGHNHMGAEARGHLEAETLGANNINLNLEIEIRRIDEESSRESVPIVVSVQAHKNADCADEVNSCAKTDVEIDENRGDNQMEGNMIVAAKPVNGSFGSHSVMELFHKAISSSDAKIVEILPCTGIVMESRLELFEKQVEITERYRREANVQYGWFPCSSRAIPAILKYGVGHYNQLKINPSHGKGIYLIPANGTQIRFDFSLFCGGGGDGDGERFGNEQMFDMIAGLFPCFNIGDAHCLTYLRGCLL
ncbi:hypothetical protein OROGR_026633 [Orobanche gracilis]